ncbi:MAG: undecaprenyl/decaprenyl-phosphate alpha-N-acetylglucosaminyl 1-phosphate transferase [Lutibacter sp.]|uniref:glycosyltransferase family 4 protein n=1 Tax=Lutibacter sp. TaxID=1925666 RepID=UPI0019FD3896|nr:MraY family glycosyltransferase [Lutibacter sp.]NOR28735.1 undecaprenyl/decaprenyl-phosphate alpha-N-acetylglucosaminyl 1-phosphate transferase [Lutibacter sp.]
MLKYVFSNIHIAGFLALIVAFALVYIIIPKIAWIVHSKNLIDHPDMRSAHKNATPTMAGFAFFLTLIFMVFLLKDWDIDLIGLNFIAGITLIVAVGLKDDLVVSSPKAKLIGEIMAIFFLLFCNCMQVISLNGFLGVHQLPMIVSIGLSILIIVTIINAYNLIDGVDGLAAVVGIVIFSIYSLIFYGTGLYYYFLLCISLIGILLAYLRYNLSSTKKIFMGDTGSLLIGYCIGFFTLKFLAMDASLFEKFTFNPENKLIIIAAILFIPLFDMIRVIGIRLLANKSPFYPDRNHVHHLLLDLGFSHFKVTFLTGFVNYVLVIGFIYLASIFDSFQMSGILTVVFVLFLGVLYVLRKRVKMKNAVEVDERVE